MKQIRIAFIKFGGLSAGGTERWLQVIAANLPKEEFFVDYYYCDAAPYISSSFQHADTDPSRLKYLQEHNVNLIKFKVGAKDITKPTHDWVDTDFWDKFDASKYDFVQTGKAGPTEYPYYLLPIPVVECVTLDAGVDQSQNIAWSFHLSQWQRRSWGFGGGRLEKSSIVPIPVLPPATERDLRDELDIPQNALVCGFHQRADNAIFSPIPIQSFARLSIPNCHFIVMGGGDLYRKQTAELGVKNVHFIDHSGESDRISAFLNTLDIFTHGRRDGETFGTVLAEAMIHGLPCISHYSLVGNNNAQLETMGPSGLFANSSNEYTEMLNELINNKDLRENLSKKSKTHTEQYYSVSACTQKVGNTYKRLSGYNIDDSTEILDYGFSPLGYLQAGDLENPASIANHILVGGIPEKYEVELTKQLIKHAKVFIDIGANIGLYCLLAAKNCPTDTKIFAFEPQPDCCRALRQTIWLNNWENKLFIDQIGIGKEPGTLDLYLSGSGSTFNNAFNDDQKASVIKVTVDTLDRQVSQKRIEHVDFIKIDVEGFEQEVLEGAEKVINLYHPILFIEIADKIRNRNYQNPNYIKTLQWLREHGYNIWRCEENSWLKKVNLNKGQEHLAMYLCLHESISITKRYRIIAWNLVYFIHNTIENKLSIFSKLFSIPRWKRFFKNPKYVLRKIYSYLNKQKI